MIGQVIVAIVALVLVVIASYRFSVQQALGLTAIASLLVSPYAYDYDLPIMGVGLALLLPDIVRFGSASERAKPLRLVLLHLRLRARRDVCTRIASFENARRRYFDLRSRTCTSGGFWSLVASRSTQSKSQRCCSRTCLITIIEIDPLSGLLSAAKNKKAAQRAAFSFAHNLVFSANRIR